MFVTSLDGWIAFIVLLVFGTLPFATEAFIQFRSWWRRLLWTLSGILNLTLIFCFHTPPEASVSVWIVGPIVFLLPAVLEFGAASRVRKHAWIWLALTPLLFGLLTYWLPLILSATSRIFMLIAPQGTLTVSYASQLYRFAAIFGAIFFTRALAGSLIASRIVR